jgi:hypothetical protein
LAALEQELAALRAAGGGQSAVEGDPAHIEGTAEADKALCDAAALWLAFQHTVL